MLHRTVARALIGVGALSLSISLVPAASAAPAAAPAVHKLAAVTLRYDDSQAAEFKAAVVAGANNWNASVSNVKFVEDTGDANAEVQIVAYDGWPETTLGPFFPGDGQGTVWYGREAVTEGYDLNRIAAHELGHILGLDDAKPGPCSSLMSGSTGGVDCTNAFPNAQEAAAVDATYANGVAAHIPHRVVLDAP